MDGQLLMAFENYEIVPVSLVVAEKEVLAVCRVDLFPILEGQLDRRERRMSMVFIFYAVVFKEGKHLLYPFVHDFANCFGV